MDASAIFDNARQMSYTNAWQVSNSTALPWLNYIYQDFVGDIIALNQNYIKDTVYIDTVVQQNVYSFTTPTNTVDADTVRKILQVSIKYENPSYEAFSPNTDYNQWDKILQSWLVYIAKADFTSSWSFSAGDWTQIYEDYINCREITYDKFDINNLNRTESYNTNDYPPFFREASIREPMYIFQNNEIFVAPFPSEAVTEWLKLQVINFAKDLTTGSTEADIKIERQYHFVLVYGLAYLIFQSQGKFQEAQNMKSQYEMEKNKSLAKITDRTITPQYVQNPDLTYLS